jgi:hypothetical protein
MMAGNTPRSGGSRYLYEPFEVTNVRLEATERVFDERWRALEHRLEAIEAAMQRLEKKIWVAVFGTSAFLLADLAQRILNL